MKLSKVFFCALALIGAGAESARAATITITCPGQDLQTAMTNAANGDTINVNSSGATCSRGDNQAFNTAGKILNIVNTSGGTVTLQASVAAQTFVVQGGGLTLDGGAGRFILRSLGTGVIVNPGAVISNVTLKNLRVTPLANPPQIGTNGMFATNTTNLVIDNVIVDDAAENGIYVSGGITDPTIKNSTVTKARNQQGIVLQNSTGGYLYNNTVVDQGVNASAIFVDNASGSVLDSNTITKGNQNGIHVRSSNNVITMNNTVSLTVNQHGIAYQLSNNGVIVGNTVTNAAFHGILLIGSQFNRVADNDIQFHKFDGITATVNCQSGASECDPLAAGNTPSFGNTILGNKIANQQNPGGGVGTGIWTNVGADAACVVLNDQSGSAEAGITTFDSSSDYILGNRVSSNAQAGVLAWDITQSTRSPDYTTIHRNYIFNNPANGDILSRGSRFGDAAYNYLEDVGDSRPGDAGISLQKPPANNPNRSSDNWKVYLNTIKRLRTGVDVNSESKNVRIFMNRFFKEASATLDNYSLLPAGVTWDGQIQLGGNWFSSHNANANPSRGSSPYKDVIVQGDGSRGTSAPYIDRYPYQNTHLGRSQSVTMVQPVTGVTAPAGASQVIEWRTAGCDLVDITAVGAPNTPIVTNYPDTGFYEWQIPGGQAAGLYNIAVTCKDSGGAVLSASATAPLTISGPGLVLLNPGWAQNVKGNNTLRVAWRRPSATFPVNVSISTDGGLSFAPVAGASNVVSVSYVDVPTPNISSNRVLYKVTGATDSTKVDTTDGYVNLRTSTAGAFVGLSAGTNLLMGAVRDLEWTQPDGAVYVDLDMFDSTGNEVRSVAKNLPSCYPKYSYLVEELWGFNHQFRLTFYDVNKAVIGSTVSSPNFNIQYTTAAGVKTTFLRLYNSFLQAHLYTTDQNEYNVLSTNGSGWAGEGPVGQLLNGPAVVDGQNAIPYFRLYRWPFTRHFYTTNRYEYFVHRDSGQMDAEGPIGYMFATQVTGTVPFYRLSHRAFPYHLYTTDAFEYSVLNTPSGGWTGEGVVGYIFPKP